MTVIKDKNRPPERFSPETEKFIAELIGNAILRAIKNGTYQPGEQKT